MKNINSTRRLTKLERLQFSLSDDLKNILVGLYLGDLYVQRRTKGSNAYLQFAQGLVNKDYLEHLYELFKIYCYNAPNTTSMAPDKRTGEVYSRVRFHTYSLPCFNHLYDLFYPEGKKIVPLNIGELLTPIGIAYWIADDGCWIKSKRHVVLSTNSFTIKEVELLIEVLNNKFNLKSYICKQISGYQIIIPSYSVSVLQSLLAPVMPSAMKHKIGL
uniref:LAGLIDADG homing endonuclease n=1 Tax=Rhizoctonia solani TaxID=456999 RepID=A0A8E8GR28_9AGAM|nr:LAGLIDADG homing endonuclease [Rhizoctonia solani]